MQALSKFMNMNYQYCFQLCAFGLKLRTDAPIEMQGNFLPFVHSALPPRLVIGAKCAPELPMPAGTTLLEENERRVLCRGSLVYRCRMRRADMPPFAVVAYDLNDPSQVTMTVRGADWSWATDHLRLWSTLSLPQLLIHQHALVFHASYILTDGAGILFTAPSGTGKSTQAELWRRLRGAEVINGDKAAVTLGPDPMVHGLPFCGTSGICHNVSAPLRAVVVLAQAPENSIERLRPSRAAAMLARNVFADPTVKAEWSMALTLLLDLVAAVPVYLLSCTPDVRAVETLEEALRTRNTRREI